MNPVPQTIGKEVTDALNDLLKQSERFHDWDSPEVHSLRDRIRVLQKVDAREAFLLFGTLAGICGRPADVLEYLRKALYLPDHEQTKHEFWGALANVGLYREAQELGTWLIDPKRGFFPKIWQRAVALGQILATRSRLAEAKRLYAEDLSRCDFSLLEQAAKVMTDHGLRDEDIGSVMNLAGEIQRTHGIMFSGKFVSIIEVLRPPEDPPYLYIAVPLDAGVPEIHVMTRELAKLVAQKIGAFPQGLVVRFTKFHPIELRAAA